MNYYCNQKFTNLQVNLERQEMNSCCTAEYRKIDVTWLKNNKNDLFNSPDIVEDRQKMLDNVDVPNCSICWEIESKSNLSRRIIKNGQEKTITDLHCKPTELSIILDTACNLTCSYCCKESSTAWLRDIEKNGVYLDNDKRFELTSYDKLIKKTGHKLIRKHKNYKLLLDSILEYSDTKSFTIVGGEPFLHYDLVDIVNQVENKVVIQTGLGINNNKFEKMLNSFHKKNFSITVSCENINDFYEFNRYGNSFSNFLKNLDSIKKYNIQYDFYSTISNLTIFGFKDFLDYFDNEKIYVGTCMDPKYLSPNLLDEKSKKIICETDYGNYTKLIHDLVSANYECSQKYLANSFINEFVRRRSLNLQIFPSHFLEWLQST